MENEDKTYKKHPITTKTIIQGAALSGAVSAIMSLPMKLVLPSFDPASAIMGSMFTVSLFISFAAKAQKDNKKREHDI